MFPNHIKFYVSFIYAYTYIFAFISMYVSLSLCVGVWHFFTTICTLDHDLILNVDEQYGIFMIQILKIRHDKDLNREENDGRLSYKLEH